MYNKWKKEIEWRHISVMFTFLAYKNCVISCRVLYLKNKLWDKIIIFSQGVCNQGNATLVGLVKVSLH